MRNPQLLKNKRSRKPNVVQNKYAQILAPPNNEMPQVDSREALWDFRCTRLKLLSILRRHEKIASILKDVKHRIEPIQFLLSTAEERSLLNASRMTPKAGSKKMQLCGLKSHNYGLASQIKCWLRLHLEEINKMDLLGEQSYAQQLKLSAKRQLQVEQDEDEAWKVFVSDCHNLDNIKQFTEDWQEKEVDDHGERLEDTQQGDWNKLLSGLNNLDINPKFDLLAGSSTKIEEESYGLEKTVQNGDWKKILNDLNDWCDQMDNATELDEILVDADASVLSSNSLN